MRYFEWLCLRADIIDMLDEYSCLFKNLYNRSFFILGDIPQDENRIFDCKDLRQDYIEDTGQIPDIDEVSVFEVIIALAIRTEIEIAYDGRSNRTSIWVQKMIESLGLSNQTNNVYNKKFVDNTIDRFLMRKYRPDGYGSLFYIPNCQYDLRKVEIWYQMLYFFDTILCNKIEEDTDGFYAY